MKPWHYMFTFYCDPACSCESLRWPWMTSGPKQLFILGFYHWRIFVIWLILPLKNLCQLTENLLGVSMAHLSSTWMPFPKKKKNNHKWKKKVILIPPYICNPGTTPLKHYFVICPVVIQMAITIYKKMKLYVSPSKHKERHYFFFII